MYCKSCGSPMEETYNVCQNCGTKKGMGAAFCEKCGEVRQAGVAFCMNCGNKFVDQPSENNTNVPFSQQTPAQQFQSNAQMNQSQYLPPKKYCRNCGAQVMNNQMVCTKCGVKVGDGKSFCPHCAAAVTNPQQVACMNCGMSLKEVFDANSFFSQFGKNFASMFNFADPAKTIFKFGPYMLALLVFIFSFLPDVAAYYSGYYSSKVTRTVVGFFGTGGMNGAAGGFIFCGVLLIFTLILMLVRFEPHIYKFIEEKPNGRLLDLVLPGLELVAIVSAIINIFNINGIAIAFNLSVHLSVCGWILLVFILASVVLTVLGLINDKDKLRLPKIDEFIFEYGSFVAAIIVFYLAIMPSIKITVSSTSMRFGYGIIGAMSQNGLGQMGGLGFANVLFIISLIVAVAGLVPPLHKIVMKNAIGGIVYFINPALCVVALISSFINFIVLNAEANGAGGVFFSFWGIVLILAVLGNGALAVLSFLKKMPKSNNNNFNNFNNPNNFNNQNNFNNPGNFNNQNGFNNNNVNANANVNNGFNNNNNNKF